VTDGRRGGSDESGGERQVVQALARRLQRLQRKEAASSVRPLKDVLARLLARRGYGQPLAAEGLEQLWRQAAGAEFADCSKPGTLRQGVLTVWVENSTVLQELAFREVALLEKIKCLAPALGIRKLKFRIGL